MKNNISFEDCIELFEEGIELKVVENQLEKAYLEVYRAQKLFKMNSDSEGIYSKLQAIQSDLNNISCLFIKMRNPNLEA